MMESLHASVVKMMGWYALLVVGKRLSSNNYLEGELPPLFAYIRCYHEANLVADTNKTSSDTRRSWKTHSTH